MVSFSTPHGQRGESIDLIRERKKFKRQWPEKSCINWYGISTRLSIAACEIEGKKLLVMRPDCDDCHSIFHVFAR